MDTFSYNRFTEYLSYSCIDIPKEGLVKKSDPFFTIRPQDAPQQGQLSTVFRSEVIKDTSTPKWAAFNVPTNILMASNGLDSKLLIEVFDWDPDATHSLIGTAVISARELLLPSAFFPLLRRDKDKAQGEIVLESSHPQLF